MTNDKSRTGQGTGTGGRTTHSGERTRSGERTGTGTGERAPADERTHTGRPTGTDEPATRTGVWFVGARGSVATTAVAGCAAVAAGLHPPTGMVTETPPFAASRLPALSSLIFGGHDTAHCPLPKRAEELTAAGVLPHGLASAVRAELTAADQEIRPGGPQPGDTRTDGELIEAFAADLRGFRDRHELVRVVVINVSSTEPLPEPGAERLAPSSLYAAAAIREGCPFVNFTPSAGLRTPALQTAVAGCGLPHAGRDGKTGQTLLRSVLAPMFVQRALPVRAWSGTNLLGVGTGGRAGRAGDGWGGPVRAGGGWGRP
ncbi:inositol-3-phosphate synthase, partial [Streptomyces sp. NPDC055078]